MSGINMIKKVQENKDVVYICEICDLSYEDKEWAKKCENWCRKNDSCNLKITSHSLESES